MPLRLRPLSRLISPQRRMALQPNAALLITKAKAGAFHMIRKFRSVRTNSENDSFASEPASPAVSSRSSPASTILSPVTEKLLESIAELRNEEEHRIPYFDLPSYCNNFLTSRKKGTNLITLKQVDEAKKEIITIQTKFSPWDELMDPEKMEEYANMEDREPNPDEDDSKFLFDVKVRKEGSPLVLMFVCIAVADEIDVTDIGIGKMKQRELLRGGYYIIPRGKLSDKILDEALDYLMSRGINAELTNHLIDYRLRDEAMEYLNWLDRVTRFLKEDHH